MPKTNGRFSAEPTSSKQKALGGRPDAARPDDHPCSPSDRDTYARLRDCLRSLDGAQLVQAKEYADFILNSRDE